MESVLDTTTVGISRVLFRIESALLIAGGIFGVFNTDLLVKKLVGASAISTFTSDPIGRVEFATMHHLIQFLLLLVIVLGVAIFYIAQAAIDPAIKRVSFLYIFLYLVVVSILCNAQFGSKIKSTPTFGMQALIAIFTLFFVFHCFEVFMIIQRRILRRFS